MTPSHLRRRRRPRIWRGVILTLALVFFIGPLLAAAKFALETGNNHYSLTNFTQLVTDGDVRSALLTSLEIGGLTMVIVLTLMLPTVVYVRLRLPRLVFLLEGVTILPIVIPPVVMAAGLASLQSHAGPELDNLLFASPVSALTPFYVILAMPFTYRALDTGLQAIDLRTLVDAARNLGASWPSVFIRVIVPNIRTAIMGAAFLALALVLGEVVISSILLYTTFPVQLIETGQASAGVSVALSLESLLVTWALLLLISTLGGRRRAVPRLRPRWRPR